MCTVKDLFQIEFSLSYEHRVAINEELKKRNMQFPHCSACESAVDITWLRKTEEEMLRHAMCVPCFVRNHTDYDQRDIDLMVKLGEKNGWYKE
jgi:hypothetical protein